MKTIFIFIFSIICWQIAAAQIIDPKAAAKRSAERRANSKIEGGIDKGMDKVEEGIGSIFKKKKKGSKSDGAEEDGGGSTSKSSKKNSSLEEDEGSEVDFVRGSTILFQDNFSKDAVGDFPAKWNSNSSGEVRTLKGFSGKFLKVPAGSLINLETKKSFPANFTIEFDIVIPSAAPQVNAGFGLGKQPIEIDYLLSTPDAFSLQFTTNSHNREWDKILYGRNINGEYTLKGIERRIPLDEVIHVGVMVNNYQRVRVYIDGKKRVDMPRVFEKALANSFYFDGVTSGAADSKLGYFYVSNIVIAETGTDLRSSVQKDLLEKGGFTTNEILFATNSDKIQSSSFSILKEIGQAMESAPDVSFMITGHTDSDGDAASNQTLSEKRAKAVKEYLVSNFNIKPANLKTSGKGESDPVASNSSADGKAQNRRVAFKKL